jgi:hypothetical protein
VHLGTTYIDSGEYLVVTADFQQVGPGSYVNKLRVDAKVGLDGHVINILTTGP